MKKIVLIILILMLSVTVLAGCVPNGKEILTGGDFQYKDIDALQEDWTLYSAGSQSSAAFTWLEKGIKISPSTSGYATVEQRLLLQPFSHYEISYQYTTTSMTGSKTDNYRGLYISFREDKNFNVTSDQIREEQSARSKNTMTYWISTENIREVTMQISFGSKDLPLSSGTATIHSISLKRIAKSAVPNTTDPKGNVVLNSMSLRPTVYSINSQLNVTYVVLGAIAIAVIAYAGYLLYVRYLAKVKGGKPFKNKFLNAIQSKAWKGLLLAIGVTLGFRLIIAIGTTIAAGLMQTVNMGFDMSKLVEYATALTNKGGTVWFLQYHAEAVMQPLQLFLAAFSGLLARMVGGSVAAYTFFIKFFAILADVGVVALIYRMLYKRVGNWGAVIASLLYAFLPLTFAMSATWGIWTSITAFLMVLTFSFLLEKKYIGVAATYFAACMFSYVAIFFAPIIIFFSVRNFIKNKKDRIPTIAATGLGFGLFYALSVPFTIQQIQAGSGGYCFTNYWSALTKELVYSQNGFNFQTLLGNNFKELSTESIVITAVLIAFIVILVAVAYFKNPNRLDIMLLSAGMIAAIFSFGNNMTPDVMYIILPLMFLFAFVAKEKRIFFLTIVYMITTFINTAYVYTVLGYTDAGIAAIPSNDPLNYVFGAINLIVVLFAVYLIFDIVVEKKSAFIRPLETSVFVMWKYRLLKTSATFQNIGKRISYFFNTAMSKGEKIEKKDLSEKTVEEEQKKSDRKPKK